MRLLDIYFTSTEIPARVLSLLAHCLFGAALPSMADPNPIPPPPPTSRRTSSGRRFQHSYVELESTPSSVRLPFTQTPSVHLDPEFQPARGSIHLAQDRLALPNDPTLLPIHQRLAAVQSSLRAHGFSSVGQCLVAELQCDEAHTRRRTARFLESDCLGQILAAASENAAFSFKCPVLRKVSIALVEDIVDTEMRTLTRADSMRKPTNSFTHSYITDFSLAALAAVQYECAPTTKRLVDVMLNSRISMGIPAHLEDEEPKPIELGKVQEPAAATAESSRTSRADLISTTAICLAAYGRSQRANALQGMMGYFLSASDAGKRVIEVLHCLGICITYESVNRALQANAKAVQVMVRKKAAAQPFFVSFDNMVFYQRVKSHTMGNRQHQSHYTAGYIAFLQGTCRVGLLPRDEMVDWGRAAQVGIEDIMVSKNTMKYTSEAAAATIWSILYKHSNAAMCARLVKRAKDGSIQKPGLEPFVAPPQFLLPLQKSDLHTMTTFHNNEAIINEVIEIVKQIVGELDLPAHQLMDKLIIFKGDYMTVRNILYVYPPPWAYC